MQNHEASRWKFDFGVLRRGRRNGDDLNAKLKLDPRRFSFDGSTLLDTRQPDDVGWQKARLKRRLELQGRPLGPWGRGPRRGAPKKLNRARGFKFNSLLALLGASWWRLGRLLGRSWGQGVLGSFLGASAFEAAFRKVFFLIIRRFCLDLERILAHSSYNEIDDVKKKLTS